MNLDTDEVIESRPVEEAQFAKESLPDGVRNIQTTVWFGSRSINL